MKEIITKALTFNKISLLDDMIHDIIIKTHEIKQINAHNNLKQQARFIF